MTTTKSFFAQITYLIGKDELGEAILILHNLLKDSPKLDEAIIQSARYNEVLKQIRLGTIELEQANITKNQIRSGLLNLVRAIETQEEQPAIHRELKHHLAKWESGSDYDLFLNDLAKFEHNVQSTTSAPLIGKTLENIPKKSLKKLFEQRRVRLHFQEHKIRKTDDTETKIRALSLMTNGYVLKGTFLCLGDVDQIRSVSQNAYVSKFFTYEDLQGLRTGITEFVMGNLVEQFEQMLDHIKLNLYLLRDIDTRTEDFEIPESVFTELLANAFIHRRYESDVLSSVKVELFRDRLEIYNPGSFPEFIDPERPDKIVKSLTINPEIVQAFFLHDFIETAGRGIQRSQEALKAYGLPPAKFEQSQGHVKVTISKIKKPKISPLLELAHDYIDKKEIPAFFSLMEEHAGKSDMLNKFQQQFLHQETDEFFFQRLKVFASTVLKNI